MIKKKVERLIGAILIDQGAISQEQLNKALEIYNERKCGLLIGEILVELGFVTEEDIIKAFLVQYKVPYLDIEKLEINPEIINLIPLRLAEKYTLIPIDKMGDYLMVAMANPLNIQALSELREISNFKNFHVYLSAPSKIKRAIQNYYKNGTIESAGMFPILPGDES